MLQSRNLRKQTWKLADIDAKIKDSDGVMMELGREEMQLQFDMSGIMQTMNRDLTNRRSEIEAELRDLQNEMNRFADTIALKERLASENEAVISNADSERKRRSTTQKKQRLLMNSHICLMNQSGYLMKTAPFAHCVVRSCRKIKSSS